MKRVRRVGFGLLVVAGLVTAIAIADHQHKQARENHAEVLAWYCKHEGTRCGGEPVSRIERAWNRRETGYQAAVAVLAAGGLFCVALPGLGGLGRRRT